jgi:hypothetical protein
MIIVVLERFHASFTLTEVFNVPNKVSSIPVPARCISHAARVGARIIDAREDAKCCWYVGLFRLMNRSTRRVPEMFVHSLARESTINEDP